MEFEGMTLRNGLDHGQFVHYRILKLFPLAFIHIAPPERPRAPCYELTPVVNYVQAISMKP